MAEATPTTPPRIAIPRGPAGAGAVFLLHGFGSTPRVMRPLATHLRRALGRETVCLPLSSSRDLRDQARSLVEAVEAHGHGRVEIVAHSMGGLVASHALKALDRGRRIARVVTLCTPHRGTPLARLSALLSDEFARVLAQMQPGATFLRELAALPVPRGSELVALAASQDRVVSAASAAVDPSPRVRSVRVEGASHSSVLVQRAVFRLVASLCAPAAPEALETAAA